MSSDTNRKKSTGISRRTFLGSAAAAAGASLAVSRSVLGQAKAAKVDDVNCAMIGVGTQGGVLLNNLLKMKGIRFKAVSDIWPYRAKRAAGYMKAYKHTVQKYEDYKEMLASEKDLDAVIIATPDWMHAPMAIDCLKAGLNVYCEKEMSNSIEMAKKMVTTAKETGKLLQIGHQRRSNPRYHKAMEYMRAKKALGQITQVQGHWNRYKMLRTTWNKKVEMKADVLKKYGYGSMEEFRNWRWYKKYSGGPIADLGSHQVDIFNWVFDAPPKSIIAVAGLDYDFYKTNGLEWYDNYNVIYEWEYDWGGKKCMARGHYQLLSTSSHDGYFETFIGDEGSLKLSENNNPIWNGIRREDKAKEAEWEKNAEMKAAIAAILKARGKQAAAAKPKPDEKKPDKKEEDKLEEWTTGGEGRFFPIPVAADMSLPGHRWHLENFFAAVRDKNVKLNCPGEVGFETCMSVLPVNDAVAQEKKLTFKPEQFKA